MSLFKKVAALVAGAVIVVGAQGIALAQGASPDDVARFLAGMQPSAGSPLAALTRNPGWQRHAKWFDSNWDTLEKRQLSKVRAWSERHLKDRQNTLYYMFSGPGLSLRQRLLSVGQHLSDERPGAGRRDSQRQRAHDRLRCRGFSSRSAPRCG